MLSLHVFLLQGSYPARLKKVLIVTAPLWFKAPFKILRLFVREKLRDRVSIFNDASCFLRKVWTQSLLSILSIRNVHYHSTVQSVKYKIFTASTDQSLNFTLNLPDFCLFHQDLKIKDQSETWHFRLK